MKVVPPKDIGSVVHPNTIIFTKNVILVALCIESTGHVHANT